MNPKDQKSSSYLVMAIYVILLLGLIGISFAEVISKNLSVFLFALFNATVLVYSLIKLN